MDKMIVNDKHLHHNVISLQVHQVTVMEKAGHQYAAVMPNDGKNACAFLCAIIGDKLLNGNELLTCQDIVVLAEDPLLLSSI